MKRLIEGATRLGRELDAGQVEQFELYYRELVEWNRKFNLTAVTDYEDVQVKHFLDSLAVTLALSRGETEGLRSIVDIGTGAGFPGVPLKIFLGKPKLVLIESVAKKAAFLRHLISRLELDNAEVMQCRSEEAARSPLCREQFTLAVSRGVASLPALAELALPLCCIGGKFVASKKGEIGGEVAMASRAIAAVGGRLSEVKRIELEELGDERYLVILDKICPTPEKYPRRPGMAKRRPL